jgi:nucleoside-diphosphate-sugar epimerase
MKVLLTGGTGFVAAHCLETLLENGSVLLLEISKPSLFYKT